ncbi:MAG: hypothetical protein KatS3mg111_2254 [Pirellulaceae bacterium]|nr:MAG: hypothetical protein KatS3mg111_2254 [Pirellulaceae bacterium]
MSSYWTPSPNIVGADIGGANLKLATCDGRTWSVPFAMWQQADELSQWLLRGLHALEIEPSEVQLAVTMTGELADCFPTRRAGVRHILAQAADIVSRPEQVAVYTVDGHWWNIEQAVTNPWEVAASNWRALAQWVVTESGARLPAVDLLIDIGSTTTDLIPLADGGIATEARTDRQRLLAGQLVYSGCQRTPLMAIAAEIDWEGRPCPLMAERFADTWDVLLVLGLATAQPQCRDSADGRPRTREYAAARIARMVGEDQETLPDSVVEAMARQFLDRQIETLLQAVDQQFRVLRPHLGQRRPRILFSGHAAGLSRELAERLRGSGRAETFYWLAELVDEGVARCAPAYACAQLWALQQAQSTPTIRVVKIGGSLLDLPNLGTHLRRWLTNETPAHHLLIVGGGEIVEAMRQLDAQHDFPPTDVHWTCVRLLEATSDVLTWMLPDLPVIGSPTALAHHLQSRCSLPSAAIVRPAAFYLPDNKISELPNGWETTSDSIAAYLALQIHATELVLLKSTGVPAAAPIDRAEMLQSWAAAGLVDPTFPIVASRIPQVRCVNFRSWCMHDNSMHGKRSTNL